MSLSINELLAYTPAQDFELSKKFYQALGFELTPAFGGTVDCRLGGAAFRLQDYYVKDWAENFMLKFDVEDVAAWHQHACRVLEGGEFGSARCDNPHSAGGADVFHIWDPSGVLLIFVGP